MKLFIAACLLAVSLAQTVDCSTREGCVACLPEGDFHCAYYTDTSTCEELRQVDFDTPDFDWGAWSSIEISTGSLCPTMEPTKEPTVEVDCSTREDCIQCLPEGDYHCAYYTDTGTCESLRMVNFDNIDWTSWASVEISLQSLCPATDGSRVYVRSEIECVGEEIITSPAECEAAALQLGFTWSGTIWGDGSRSPDFGADRPYGCWLHEPSSGFEFNFDESGDHSLHDIDPICIDISSGVSDLDPTSDPTMGDTGYEIGELGDTCEEYNLIRTAEICEEAALELGYDFYETTPFDLWSGPYGCISSLTSDEVVEVYFNSNEGGEGLSYVQPVCMSSGAFDDPTMDPTTDAVDCSQYLCTSELGSIADDQGSCEELGDACSWDSGIPDVQLPTCNNSGACYSEEAFNCFVDNPWAQYPDMPSSWEDCVGDCEQCAIDLAAQGLCDALAAGTEVDPPESCGDNPDPCLDYIVDACDLHADCDQCAIDLVNGGWCISILQSNLDDINPIPTSCGLTPDECLAEASAACSSLTSTTDDPARDYYRSEERCPADQQITSPEECDAAAGVLGFVWSDKVWGDGSSDPDFGSDRPYGCYLHEPSGQFEFNYDVNGQHSLSDIDPICIEISTTTAVDLTTADPCQDPVHCNCDCDQLTIATLDDFGCPSCACIDNDAVPSYQFGEASEVCDPWQVVSSEDDCRAAAEELGGAFVPTLDFNDWESPYGCIADLNEGGEIFFNSNENGSASDSRRPVCTTDEYATASPTCTLVCEDDNPLTMMPDDTTDDPDAADDLCFSRRDNVCESCVAGKYDCSSCVDGYELYYDEDFGIFYCRASAQGTTLEPTLVPSNAPSSSLYFFVESDTKCPLDEEYRTFKLDLTTERQCAVRCRDDATCAYFSIGWGLCIGCTQLPSSLDGSYGWYWETFAVNYDDTSSSTLPINSPVPTKSPTLSYNLFSMDTKCPVSDRTFKLDFTSLEGCASRCRSDLDCQYFTINAIHAGVNSCIGCTVVPTDYHDGAESYSSSPPEDCSVYEDDDYLQCLELRLAFVQDNCDA